MAKLWLRYSEILRVQNWHFGAEWAKLTRPVKGYSLDRLFTAQCTLVQCAVLRSHVIRLSVRPSVTLVDCEL